MLRWIELKSGWENGWTARHFNGGKLANALMKLGICFFSGELGVIPNEEKGVAYFKDAAKKGDVFSRYNLGVIEEERNEEHYLAIKHYKLAAAAGHEPSTKRLWKYFSLEKLDKAELEETLRAHKEACDEMNSEERERYTASEEALEGNDDTLKNIYELYYSGLMTAKELNMSLKAHRGGDIAGLRNMLLKASLKARD